MTLDELKEYRGFDSRGWICDTCGQIIERAEDGWVQWRTRESDLRTRRSEDGESRRPMGQDLQLVHHLPASPLVTKPGTRRSDECGCQFAWRDPEFSVSDQPLVGFLGPNGLMRLLALISERQLRTREVLEMIKRLHIPGYEHTRLHFDEAIARGVFEPNTAPGYYCQADIEAVDAWLRERD